MALSDIQLVRHAINHHLAAIGFARPRGWFHLILPLSQGLLQFLHDGRFFFREILFFADVRIKIEQKLVSSSNDQFPIPKSKVSPKTLYFPLAYAMT